MTAEASNSGQERPILDGIRVVDGATWLAGPTAATVMADFGADVIKVEPPGGDGYRRLHETPGFPETEVDCAWQLDNRNKRSIMLDLGDPDDKACFQRLVADADIFVTNHPHPVRRKFGLTYDDLAPLNPRLIYASLTAYGEAGAEADNAGFDLTAYWARSGLMHLVRPDMSGPPTPSVAGQGDHPTGIALFGAIMLALYERERTGRGREVHTSLIANGLWSNAVMATAAIAGAEPFVRRPREAPFSAQVNYYPTRDGRWFILSALDPERDFRRILEVIERQDLADDPRFATNESRMANATELTALFEACFRAHDWSHWQPRFAAVRLAVGTVFTPEEIVADPQAQASGAVRPGADGSLLDRVIDTPLWVTGHQKTAPGRAPTLDEHGTAIRAALAGGRSPWAT